MFVQVITGKANDIDTVRGLIDRWDAELRPGAVGFVGATEGFTDDGRFFVMARFESPEAAEKNSTRAEQDAWWQEVVKVTDDVVVHNCSRVETLLGGGKDSAGFVQVMSGRIKDAAKADALFARADEQERVLGGARPDVIGEVTAIHDDGSGYTDVVYFSSEAEARANEQHELPADAAAIMAELESAFEVTEYLDLREPILR